MFTHQRRKLLLEDVKKDVTGPKETLQLTLKPRSPTDGVFCCCCFEIKFYFIFDHSNAYRSAVHSKNSIS